MPTTRAPAGKTKSKAAGSRREQIVECAIQLFNQFGIQSVPIDRIADELLISPGNLTYHFNRREDLIRATLDLLKERMFAALRKPDQLKSAEESGEYLVRMFRTFWEYRFFFNALAHLLSIDERYRDDYDEIRLWVIETIESDIIYCAELGLFLPASRHNTYRMLAENVWSLLMNWMRMQQTLTPSAQNAPNDGLLDMAMQLWSLSDHWLSAKYSKQLRLKFLKVLADAPAPASTKKAAQASSSPRLTLAGAEGARERHEPRSASAKVAPRRRNLMP